MFVFAEDNLYLSFIKKNNPKIKSIARQIDLAEKC